MISNCFSLLNERAAIADSAVSTDAACAPVIFLRLIEAVFYLVLVSFIWTFAFGLIKNKLGGLDPTAMAVVRIGFALLIFLPLLRVRALSGRKVIQLFLIGAIEFGVMYLLYLRAFVYLKAFEVALFTITTPLYLALAEAFLARRIYPRHWLAAILSFIAASIIVWRHPRTDDFWHGLILLQFSNLCFAGGQLAYRRIRKSMTGSKDGEIFGWLYLGAFSVTLIASAFFTDWAHFRPNVSQWEVLAYLGILSSGLCFFWWNRGALRVNAGTLAAMNNAKIPLAVAASLLVFHEQTDLARLIFGGVLLVAAVWMAERDPAKEAA